MIPALLCCLFVIYLYRTLNEPSGDAIPGDSSNSNPPGQSAMEGLERELVLLRGRLQALAAAQAGEESE